MTRITSGLYKNKKLNSPQVEGIRLVQDKVKLAIFSIIGAHKVENKRCLDLFAGSGSLGFEALSRSAAWCDFVDAHYNAIGAINLNAKSLNLENFSAIKSDATKYAANTEKTYDLVFADPFYDDTKHRFLLKNLEELLNENGVIVFLHGDNLDIQDQIADTSLKIYTQRKFGAGNFTILSM